MGLTTYRQSAFINECLRLAYGITARLPRVAPTEALQYKEYTIPPGVSDESPAQFPSFFPRFLASPSNLQSEKRPPSAVPHTLSTATRPSFQNRPRSAPRDGSRQRKEETTSRDIWLHLTEGPEVALASSMQYLTLNSQTLVAYSALTN
jgi:hypothetical protein